MSICPKNKSSKARRDKRRANWKMSAPNLVKCSKCGALMMPHRVCKSCGSYNKKEIVAVAYFLLESAIRSCVPDIRYMAFLIFNRCLLWSEGKHL